MSLRVSDDEYLTLLARTGKAESATHYPKASKPNKYRAVRKEVDGHVFHSTAEAKRYVYLRSLRDRGLIKGLEVQHEMSFYLHEDLIFTYVADFRYFQNDTWVIEDVKGHKTDVYKLKKRIIEKVYDCTIIEIKTRR